MPYTVNQLNNPELLKLANGVSAAITNKMRGHGTPYDVPFIAYLFYKLSNTKKIKQDLSRPINKTAEMQLERFNKGEIILNPYVLNSLDRTIKNCFIQSYEVFERLDCEDIIYAAIVLLFDNYLRDFIDKSSGEKSTPDSIVKLAQSILDIKDTDKVADICCGNGNFITKCIDIAPKAKYYGYERDIRCAAVLAMKADILGIRPSIVMGDIEYTLSDNSVLFDKIFSNYPLSMRFNDYGHISHRLPFSLGKGGDWYFNNVVVEHLSKDGKGVTIAGVGTTWNELSKDARKYFIENGYIEAVVNLPGGLIPGSTIPLSLYVFSKNNRSVRLVDAEGLGIDRQRSARYLTTKNIKEIKDLLAHDSDNSISITLDEVRNNNYSLAFKSYHSGLPKYTNGVKLSEVSEIIRGSLNPRVDTSSQNTGKYLLQISDLDNGMIKDNLGGDRFIKSDKKTSEQKLLPFDLVITRSAQPVKIAIVSPDEKRELYPNGNMFVIRIKNHGVNPYYLLSFLLSDDGKDALDYASTGNALKTISAGSLAELIFPLKDLKEQKKIADVIIESSTEYKAYSHKADLAKNHINNAFYYNEEA